MNRPVLIGLTVLLLAFGLALSLLRPAAGAALATRDLAIGESGVVEVLRLRVPAAERTCWRQAEAHSWEPWLLEQAGYRGRELLWDARLEEGMLLIGWARQSDWDAIAPEQIEAVQARFEAEARRCLGRAEASANPFPLLSSGALLPER
ncbi:TIGR03792 family protein [Synechococcus sp. CS-1325]|uniref:TIGR03792 family protein n=1 Tax=unclassified Synechococcus TaxID=2626047 RepID=UPI000DB0102F|nr:MULTISPECIES: TIGR03792 family protein [unclassified Synechococcus]MCT0198206.1 TIGR03792 family protein [Synechococcus sp. CS-1325]MCT0229521.1 TIGR03792 family protein [Synechococcus sp. CS-1324]PZU99140.1 MAG: TIGR03792 family protein [Cyanobium sp.]PZV03517.1 MAG: TIGR03792 family protein [Cyanobium sp.]